MIRLSRPVPISMPISSKFGNRIINGRPEFHKGVDFATPVGTPVKAVIPGTVHRAGWENENDPKQGFGLRVMQKAKIDGEDCWIFYAHLNQIDVNAGEEITVGQLIGKSGHTGRSTGPHLHVGCRKSNTNEWQDMEFDHGA